MTINLGTNFLLLIILSLMEILFIIIPALISSKIRKITFFMELSEMGFLRGLRTYKQLILKVISGLTIGALLFLISPYLLSLITNSVLIPLFGVEFVQNGIENAISTQPVNPSLIELSILIIIQITIIGPCEEAFFRGFLISKFNKKVKLKYAILFSSLIFTFYHTPFFLVPISTIILFFPYYFVIGLILALVFVYFKYSLLPCIVAHSIFNIFILLL